MTVGHTCDNGLGAKDYRRSRRMTERSIVVTRDGTHRLGNECSRAIFSETSLTVCFNLMPKFLTSEMTRDPNSPGEFVLRQLLPEFHCIGERNNILLILT